MTKSVFRLSTLLGLLACLLAGGALYAAMGAGSGSHLERSACASCHLGGADVTAQQAGLLTGSQEVLCAKCHPASIQMSHPSGFEPKTVPPAGYPLDWKGDLTCSTCHDIHGTGRGLVRGSKVGKALCLACHDADFFQKMRDGGASLMVGHLSKGIDSNAPALDVYSRQCMECHAVAANPKLSVGIDRNGVVRHASQGMNHPIGMSYQKAATFGGYRPRRNVERKLALPDGKVSCVTCHVAYQKKHGQLVLPKEQSALCYECHDL
jgi:predicted CXXCH cytochrome family protein